MFSFNVCPLMFTCELPQWHTNANRSCAEISNNVLSFQLRSQSITCNTDLFYCCTQHVCEQRMTVKRVGELAENSEACSLLSPAALYFSSRCSCSLLLHQKLQYFQQIWFSDQQPTVEDSHVQLASN